ncbi:response regulator [Microvirga sesbaniae]|uniref:response regulator n=1 Tax=Microvirga sesbaniae TaxID=681392 RepID=UPI0021C7A3C1|nr:response regulator [Microvirga sp. HBU67692]
MSTSEAEHVLVVDDNHIFRETLAQRLRDAGHRVTAAESAEKAFFALRDWSRPVGWLYTRACLPGLIDGWILADEYHDHQRRRAVIIAASEARESRQGDIVLNHPSVTTVLEMLRHAIEAARARTAVAPAETGYQRRAA